MGALRCACPKRPVAATRRSVRSMTRRLAGGGRCACHRLLLCQHANHRNVRHCAIRRLPRNFRDQGLSAPHLFCRLIDTEAQIEGFAICHPKACANCGGDCERHKSTFGQITRKDILAFADLEGGSRQRQGRRQKSPDKAFQIPRSPDIRSSLARRCK